MSTHKPATPLPWKWYGEPDCEGEWQPWYLHQVGHPRDEIITTDCGVYGPHGDDHTYIAHACNAYPELVAERDHHRETLRAIRDAVSDRERIVMMGVRAFAAVEHALREREPWLFDEDEAPPKTGLTRSGHGIITGLRRGQP